MRRGEGDEFCLVGVHVKAIAEEPCSDIIEAHDDKVGRSFGKDVGGGDSAVVDVHLEATLGPRGVDKFQNGGGKNGGEDRGEGGAWGVL